MLQIIGSKLCSDCIETLAYLDQKRIPYEFQEIADSIEHLKRFILFRDREPLFDQAKNGNFIGIPYFVKENGSPTFSLTEALQDEASFHSAI